MLMTSPPGFYYDSTVLLLQQAEVKLSFMGSTWGSRVHSMNNITPGQEREQLPGIQNIHNYYVSIIADTLQIPKHCHFPVLYGYVDWVK